jgi:hypothetical protein
MSDEDILCEALATGKVRVNGEEYSIKAPEKPPTFVDLTRTGDKYILPVQKDKIPELKMDQFYPVNTSSSGGFYVNPTKIDPPERPEVVLREGIRLALRSGIPFNRIKEIFDLELVEHICDS